MTVKELMDKLSQYPPSTRVVTAGFDEGGLDDVFRVEAWVIFRDGELEGHRRRHVEAANV